MADQFDSLMGSGAGSLAALSAFAGGIRRENEALTAQRQQTGFEALQALSQERLSMRQSRLVEQQLASQQAMAERELAFRREESAFARLNDSLRMQMEFADRESARRDQAFQNAMKAELFTLETKKQSYQLQQVERSLAAQDLLGTLGGLSARMYAGEYNGDLGAYGDDLSAALLQNPGGMAFLMASEEGRKELGSFNAQIRASRLRPTRVPKLSLIDIGQSFDEGEVFDTATKVDMSRALTADELQSVAYLVERAKKSVTMEDLANSGLGEDATKDQVELTQVLAYAEQHKNIPHWDNLTKQLKTAAGKARFADLSKAGLLSPITDKRKLEQLNLLAQAEMTELAEMISLTNGKYLISPEYKPAYQKFLADSEMSRNEIISGGDLSKSWLLNGGRTFDSIHEAVMGEADNRRTIGDWTELTGLPGAGRVIRSAFTGEKVSGSDWADLILTGLMFVPGAGWVARGALGAGKFVLGTGARLVGRGATLRAGGRAAAAQTFARTQGLRGAMATERAARAAPPGSAMAAADTFGLTREAVRAAIPGAAREAIGTAAVATRTGMFFTSAKDFNDLQEAKEKVEDNIRGIQVLGPTANPRIFDELANNILEYQGVAARYFAEGKIPDYLKAQLFDLRGIVPFNVIQAVQVNQQKIMAGQAGVQGVFSNDDIRNRYLSRQVQAAQMSGQRAAPGIQGMTQSGGFNLLAQP